MTNIFPTSVPAGALDFQLPLNAQFRDLPMSNWRDFCLNGCVIAGVVAVSIIVYFYSKGRYNFILQFLIENIAQEFNIALRRLVYVV